MMRSFAPVTVTFVQDEQKRLQLVLLNDSRKKLSCNVNYGMRTLTGKTLWQKSVTLAADSGLSAMTEVVEEHSKHDCYLFAEYVIDGNEHSVVFSYDMWHTCKFASDYVYTVEKQDGCYAVTIKANQFAKGVTLRMTDNYKFTYSDNYVDLQAGEQTTLYIYGANEEDIVSLEVTDFANEIK